MARQSVSKHLGVLEEANLVSTLRTGREKLHYLNAAPINEISERWIDHYDQDRIHALADLKTALEEKTVEKPSFVYTTYIHTTPQLLWLALTEPAFTRRYFDTEFETDWRAGSPVVWHHHGVKIAHPEQVVLEAEPYRRLSYTWHSFTPEWARTVDLDDEQLAKIAVEPRSKVTFEIEPAEELVRLTVTHEGFEHGSAVLEMVNQGWPRLLAELKTLLETGETTPAPGAPLPAA